MLLLVLIMMKRNKNKKSKRKKKNNKKMTNKKRMTKINQKRRQIDFSMMTGEDQKIVKCLLKNKKDGLNFNSAQMPSMMNLQPKISSKPSQTSKNS